MLLVSCALESCEVWLPEGSPKNQKYCAPTCRDRASYERARADGRYVGRYLASSRKGSVARAARREDRTCRFCDQPASARSDAVTCGSAECKRRHKHARSRDSQRKKRAEFAARGESYRDQWARTDDYGDGKQRAGGGDTIRRVVLGNRDNWTCGICRQPIDPHSRHPDLQSGSIDHIIPLGPKFKGTHTWDNVQIAHYLCNIRKKDRLNWTPEEANSERT